jgi:hypothetical protein
MIGIASVVARMTDKDPFQARSGPHSQNVPPTSPMAPQNALWKGEHFKVPPSPHKGDRPPAAANPALTGSAPKSGASWVPPVPSSQHQQPDVKHFVLPWGDNEPSWEERLAAHLKHMGTIGGPESEQLNVKPEPEEPDISRLKLY